jgi:hypothetical protein
MSERLKRRMRKLYRRYYAECFWGCRTDLEMTRPLLGFVLSRLRSFGGRRGYLDAAKLAEIAKEEGELCSRGS